MKAFLYDANGGDRETELLDEVVGEIAEGRLLWVDIDARRDNDIDAVATALSLTRTSVSQLKEPKHRPRLDNFGDYLQFGVLAPPSASPKGEPCALDDPPPVNPDAPTRLDLVVGERWLITVHDRGLHFLEAFRAQDKGETKIGALSPHALAASLLDWHLETFFHEVARVEGVVDQIDERILRDPRGETMLSRMLQVRRRISALRRLLVAQRNVFYGLSRPDLMQVSSPDDPASHYQALAHRFERAVDEVEHTRDLLLGSFELFSSRTSSETNDLVKTLTFITVLIGGVAAIAGLFGMNFDTPLFRTGAAGFFAVTGGLSLVAVVFWLVARAKRWI